ncbi:MAG: hydantoinase/oxoprolinase family protein, partial [Elioraea sp.]|nr:hydantoinase/oxoprolinase family protein [Elioraea sp.]
ESAGSDPGPACYGRGGTEPTFTDAMVVLGYLNPEAIAGGEVQICAELAHRAIADRLARPLACSLEAVAYGILTLASATMKRAVKAVTTNRGRDPRDFTLFAFGGNGPVAATALAEELGITRILVPPGPGVFSAFGLPLSDVEREVSRSVMLPCTSSSAAALVALLQALEAEARQGLTADGHDASAARIERLAELRFAGQAFELSVPVQVEHFSAKALAEAFVAEHRRSYGHGSEQEPVQVVTLRLRARIPRPRPSTILWPKPRRMPRGERRAFFGPRCGWLSVAVLCRGDLGADWREGPLIVEEDDATTIVAPGWKVRRDTHCIMEIRRETVDAYGR